MIAGWSSPVARWAHNPKVSGSNPDPATNKSPLKMQNSAFLGGFLIYGPKIATTTPKYPPFSVSVKRV